MNKDIKYAYTELKNKFGKRKDVIFDEVVSKEVAHKTVVKVDEQPKVESISIHKTRTNGPTTESLLELQKYFNFK